MERIVFLDRSAIPVALRPPCFPHQWLDYPDTAPEQLVERLRGASIAITDRVFFPREALEQLPELKLIAVAATGVDGIDLDTCRERGIAVSNVRDWALSVPEHVFALILALRRNLIAYHEAVQGGGWQHAPGYLVQLEPLPQSLAGATLGLIGYGALGRAVAGLASAFGMNVLVAEQKGAAQLRPGRSPFDEVLANCDVLVVLCPLTPATRGMIGAQDLGRMPRNALLINCARGGIVDEAALARALSRGDIAGAGLDVLSQEPPRDGSPLLELKLPNLIITPHVAWVSEQSLRALADRLIDNLEAFHAGIPRNLVT
ncbi:lactate dehydrogenase [Geomonas limicola]|uniref:Lactate dehydrogenase n=1 Tax=Geomonas limicola TaxID=2740186 RepID=A0A6V8N773_9BACT|nr:D-2-hydroxyacid dehydrogenase [Geomonas limicola]GFO67129.1 lactate dehydrogenase [Geomonas limicola]